MLAFKLALRGLWRHKVRSLLTLIAIAFGHFMLIVFLGLGDGMHEEMIEVGVRQGSAGHVVVQSKGYQEERAVELLVPNAERIRRTIKTVLPRAKVVLRAFGGGLAKTADNVTGVLFAGVESRLEGAISRMACWPSEAYPPAWVAINASGAHSYSSRNFP